MKSFVINGLDWHIRQVYPNDPHLIDRRHRLTLATTDPMTRTIYISSKLYGNRLKHVFVHELGHVIMLSYNIIIDIHRMVKKEYWVEMEELICNLIADYAEEILDLAFEYVGGDAYE